MSNIPSSLIAGDTWSWTDTFSDYQAPTWVATVYFENKDDNFSAVAAASGSDHVFSINAATSSGKKPGRYKWSIRVASGGTVYTVESGWVEVLADPAAAGNSDQRSWARRTLEAVEAFLEGSASGMQQSMSINGRAISRWSREELYRERDRLRAEVAADERGSNRSKGRYIKVRLTR